MTSKASKRVSLRASLWLGVATLTMTTAEAACAQSTAAQVNVPAQSLSTTLTQIGRQTGAEVIFSASDVRGKRAPAVSGSYSTEQALKIALRGSGLSVRRTSQGAFLVQFGQQPISANETGSSSGEVDAQGGSEDYGESGEIVVTAQKREERLKDVPVPATAISAQSLIENNQLRLQDFYTAVPGLNLTASSGGFSTIAIRGVTTGGFSNPTVGIVVDGVPYGSSTSNGGAFVTPDIDPGDLQRLEVLRGPQGTLYGTSSLGGLINYVTIDPSTNALSGRVQAGFSSVRNGEQLGYNLRGSINIPVNDVLAVRASGYTRLDPGFVDVPAYIGDPSRGKEGVNRGKSFGGRLALIWRPAEIISVKLSATYQDNNVDGQYYVTPGLGDLQQSSLRSTGKYANTTEVYTASINAELGQAQLTSISGYNVNVLKNRDDFTVIFGGVSQSVFGVAGTLQIHDRRTNKFTQELRLVTPIGERLDWLAGAYYTSESTSYETDFLAVDPATLNVAGSYFHGSIPSSLNEYALFTDLTWKVTDKLDVQFGGRFSHIRQKFSQFYDNAAGVFFNGVRPYVVPTTETTDRPVTYLVTPRLRISPDFMIYARFASGFRAGGPNYIQGPGIPTTYGPDKTRNYELGMKGDIIRNVLSVDASVYHIEWRDIQIQIFDPTLGGVYYANASAAKSEGLELSAELKPWQGMVLSGWFAYNNAVVTDGTPVDLVVLTFTERGDRLPFSSKYSGNLAANQEFDLGGDLTGSIGGTFAFVGQRAGGFKSGPGQTQPQYPGYGRLDLRAGLRYGSWSADAYVTNVTDKRGVLSRDPTNGGTYIINPRTIGLNISKRF